ncbi:hypothetical protein LOTGIDRAFT_233748 [Lottia gigantea]|uniref:Hcy-binding domain-containing protein n=1 Tax=Lottia gigantea TaxID=225164 RepID=V3ZGT9_LOTGI|nr:hypothetical protein LOTGIDRAFT_233748 [Lottia gigantea]ESO90438.1 hypothetical protein LOTGIDRAFT_233748 [Lottia gigantea]
MRGFFLQNKTGLKERLENNETVIVAEGYLFEFERRGLLKAGSFVPEVVLEHPELVRQLHEEFVRAGSDVVLAFTYYGHREKLRIIGKEDQLETLNRRALKIAREVADETGTLMAGNICNTTLYVKDDADAIEKCRSIFKEQIEWAVEGGAEFIVGETFADPGEALLALECIKRYGRGLPAVISMSPFAKDTTYDGYSYGDVCKQLEDAGADVVGLNCGRGPATITPLIKDAKLKCKGPLACLPVTYRTTEKQPNFQSLADPVTGQKAFPVDLPAHTCGRTEIREWAEEMKALGIQYIGLCCGNASHYLREVAEVYGRSPPASRFSTDMSQHFVFGNRKDNNPYYTETMRNYMVQ